MRSGRWLLGLAGAWTVIAGTAGSWAFIQSRHRVAETGQARIGAPAERDAPQPAQAQRQQGGDIRTLTAEDHAAFAYACTAIWLFGLAGIGHAAQRLLCRAGGPADVARDPARRVGCPGVIRRNGQHLLHLIDNLLSVLGVEGGWVALGAGRRDAHAVPNGVTGILTGVRVLLAEDGLANQRLATAILSKAGAEVVIAGTGRAALDLAARQAFDLALMDMQMPEMDGCQATAELRRRGFSGPIIALTAQSLPGDRQRCMAAGCTEYLAKPVDRRALLQAAARAMGAPPDDRRTADVAPPARQVRGAAEAIDSDLVGDPVIAPILDRFVSGLPGRTGRMRQALAHGDFEELGRLAHQLKGAAGGYGYPELTDSAEALEEAATSGDHEAAAIALAVLGRVSRAVVRGRDGARAADGIAAAGGAGHSRAVGDNL